MSVEVKTPTREQFEHSEFPCPSSSHGVRPGVSPAKKGPVYGVYPTRAHPGTSQDDFQIGLHQDDSEHFARVRKGSLSRKRRGSEKPANVNQFAFNPKKRARARRNSEKEKIVLPSKFFNGGTITDPLNLSGPGNELLNENTPVSSPLPLPVHKSEVKVLLPPNITDPLALNAQGDKPGLVSPKMGPGGKKKKKHRKKKSTEVMENPEDADVAETGSDLTKALSVDLGEQHTSPPSASSATDSLQNKLKRIADAIVSPAIPQMSPKLKRRKHTSSECSVASGGRTLSREDSDRSNKGGGRTLSREDSDRSNKGHRRAKYKRQGSNQSTQSTSNAPPRPRISASAKKASKFIYGNYDRYYGYRNPDSELDPRIKCLHRDWFEDKHVLDVGCNVGHVTLAIAKELKPKRIVGIDIDHKLISGAKKNIRYLLSKAVTNVAKFPASLSIVHGPIAAPPLILQQQSSACNRFPNNVMFMQGNYVMEKNDQVNRQQEEYDVILFFSISKWIHLNWGDDGLKRAFRRVFKQLRPGGRFILEPQSWASYKRRTKLNETIQDNYKNIHFRPDQFTEFLLSPAVGFTKCEQLEVPLNRSKGFQRPIFMYTKAAPSPYHLTPSASSTPGTLRPAPSRAANSETCSPTLCSPCVEATASQNEPRTTPDPCSSSNTSSSSSTDSVVNSMTPVNLDLNTEEVKVVNGVNHSDDE